MKASALTTAPALLPNNACWDSAMQKFVTTSKTTVSTANRTANNGYSITLRKLPLFLQVVVLLSVLL